ncbi:uncharacterized protein LALA0_S02e05116g [Lachancea lanzarotensis]|uniref:LALA0S02e05116g1_1 n=1 Tax=Lachancea lanzarotensis TaxID=1245769 RepID=A0A0C7MMI6_9SACH|nr:uncharacterized protein LALA0_S02e05116g [Lachancea lanzarotensis]CEP61028.1 LALA0S02e05116g1_1 [Lachancea lanzarotensis]
MAMQIQVDTASSTQDLSSTVSYAFLGSSSGGVLSLDQSQILSTTAISGRPRYTRSDLESGGSESISATPTSGSGSSHTNASSASSSSSISTGTTSTTGSTSASPSLQPSNGVGSCNGSKNWKMGAVLTLLTAFGALTV